jgi:hypothetical protein
MCCLLLPLSGALAQTNLIPSPQQTLAVETFLQSEAAAARSLALTGYLDQPLQVFKLDPATGQVFEGPITIASPAQPSADGFAVLPNGNFLINDRDGADGYFTYREYDGAPDSPTKGQLVPDGLTIDLNTLAPDCYHEGTGVALAPDGQSLYFAVNTTDNGTLNIMVQVELVTGLDGRYSAGRLLGSHQLDFGEIEDIDVVVPQ